MPDPPGPCVHPDTGAYALGLLEAAERLAYEQHLAACAQCLRTLESLAPLVELLSQVDAATLLADAERRRARRPPAHLPGAVGSLFPRQREPCPGSGLHPAPRLPGDPAPRRDRRRPHLRAWHELDDRFRTAARPEPEPVVTAVEPGDAPVRPGRTAPRTGNSEVLRRLVLAAAVLTVVTMISLVTLSARSSVTDPGTAAPPSRGAAALSPTAAVPPAAASPPTAASRTSLPAVPPHPPTPRRSTPPPARTREKTTPVPSTSGPDQVKANPGGGAPGDRLTGRDPTTGAAAQVRLRETAAGLDVSLTVTGLPGPRDYVLRVISTGGAAGTALRWRMADGQDDFTGLGSTTVDRGEIDRFEVVEAGGAVLVTISSR